MNIDLGLIINQIIDNFDFAYMIVVNVLTYLIIKFIENFHKTNKLVKRIVLIISIIIIASVYCFTGERSLIILVNSSILAPVFYSWILKPILDKFGLGYINLSIE